MALKRDTSVVSLFTNRTMVQKKAKRNKIIWTSIVVLWVLFIWANSLTSGEGSSKLSSGVLAFIESAFSAIGIHVQISSLFIRKAAHFMEYFILGVFTYSWAFQYTNKSQRKKILYALVFATLIAAIDESIQYFIPGRAAMALDVALDVVGAIFGIICTMLILRRRASRKIKEPTLN